MQSVTPVGGSGRPGDRLAPLCLRFYRAVNGANAAKIVCDSTTLVPRRWTKLSWTSLIALRVCIVDQHRIPRLAIKGEVEIRELRDAVQKRADASYKPQRGLVPYVRSLEAFDRWLAPRLS